MLTDREKKLMRVAHEVGFLAGIDDAENGHSNYKLSERFDDWLSEPAADCGITVEMVIAKEI